MWKSIDEVAIGSSLHLTIAFRHGRKINIRCKYWTRYNSVVRDAYQVQQSFPQGFRGVDEVLVLGVLLVPSYVDVNVGIILQKLVVSRLSD